MGPVASPGSFGKTYPRDLFYLKEVATRSKMCCRDVVRVNRSLECLPVSSTATNWCPSRPLCCWAQRDAHADEDGAVARILAVPRLRDLVAALPGVLSIARRVIEECCR